MIPLEHFLILAAAIFSVGLMIVIVKRNAIAVLLGIELMLNASNINLVGFNMAFPERLDGQLFALFVIIVAVCEAAVGLAIILRIYSFYHTTVPDDINMLRDS